jgi:hypothetical protein
MAGFQVTLYGRFWVFPEDSRRVHPKLTETDLKKENSNEHSQICLDPYKYRDLLIC